MVTTVRMICRELDPKGRLMPVEMAEKLLRQQAITKRHNWVLAPGFQFTNGIITKSNKGAAKKSRPRGGDTGGS